MSSMFLKNCWKEIYFTAINGRISMHFNYQIIFDKNTEKELKKNVSEDLGLSETSFSLYFSNFRTL